MKSAKNELLMFLGGLAMLVVGLFIFSQKVVVSSSWFGGTFNIGGFRMNSGLVMIPLIIGIVWMFATSSFASKVFTGFAALLIVVSVILSTNIHLTTITLYDWVLMLVLIFGGLGFLARVLLANDSKVKEKKEASKSSANSAINSVDEQLEAMKKKL